MHADGRLSHIIGGEAPTLAHATEGLPFAHGHMSQVTASGSLMVFSNGEHDHRTEGSKVVELVIDEPEGLVRTVASVPEPEQRFVGYLGDGRRLEGGHTLMVNPDHGIYELDAVGAVVWEGHQDPEGRTNYNVGRVEPVAALSPYGP